MIDQVIIRNGMSGYEIIKSTREFSPDFDYSLLMPHIASKNKNIRYFSKLAFNEGNITNLLLKLIIADGTDKYDRAVMKTHCIIIDKKEYSERGGLYSFIQPLIRGRINRDEDIFLSLEKETDLISIKGFSELPYSLLYSVLTNPLVKVCRPQYDLITITQLFGLIDRCLPEEITDQVSMLSYILPVEVGNLNRNLQMVHTKNSVQGIVSARKPKIPNIIFELLNHVNHPELKDIQKRLVNSQVDPEETIEFYQKLHKRFSLLGSQSFFDRLRDIFHK